MCSSLDCYPEVRAVLRAISNSALSLLAAITLFWGGCISCPQFFMFPTAEETEKSCCNKAGNCERPEKTAPEKECKLMPLELQAFGSADVQLAAAGITTDVLPFAPIFRPAVRGMHFETEPVEHSPPDLTVLHSTLLI